MTQHLHDVDESYFQHMRHALSFTAALFWAALCCLVHALIPFVCEQRGSQLVSRLHDRMVLNRHLLSNGYVDESQSVVTSVAEQVRDRQLEELGGKSVT